MFTIEKRGEGTIVFLLRHKRQYPLLTTPERTQPCFLGEDYSSHSAIFKENLLELICTLDYFISCQTSEKVRGKARVLVLSSRTHCHPIKTLCHAFCWAFPSPPFPSLPRIKILSGGPTNKVLQTVSDPNPDVMFHIFYQFRE